jgi:hypothetical protein
MEEKMKEGEKKGREGEVTNTKLGPLKEASLSSQLITEALWPIG